MQKDDQIPHSGCRQSEAGTKVRPALASAYRRFAPVVHFGDQIGLQLHAQGIRDRDTEQPVEAGNDANQNGTQAYRFVDAGLDHQGEGFGADSRDEEAQAKHVADLAGGQEIDLDARRRDAYPFLGMEVGETGVHPFGEPVFDQLVDDDEILRIEDDPRRVAMVETDQMALLEMAW